MNMKVIQKHLCSLILFLLVVTFSCKSFAVSNTQKGTTTLELVDNTICTITVDDKANFEKKITKFNKEERSATLTLTITNLKTVEESRKPVEVFLVIDNSDSMVKNEINNITRKQAVINSANVLIDKLFSENENLKVGVVSFSSLDSSKGETEGTINDAKLVLGLNNSKSDVKSAIESISSSKTGPRTNIEAGITIASQNYSKNSNTNRYIVLLTDGVPNNALDGTFSSYIKTAGARTKSKLQQIENDGINVIGAMIGLDGERVEPQSNKTYKALAEEVFGTVDNPTISNYYYIPDDQIEETIANKIFQNLVSRKDNTLKNIVIKDYFPQEIIDNFDFEYVASPNIGKVSTVIDKTDNSITWVIEFLKEGEIATLSYKLTLKENYNKEIINKVLPTNEKVDITAEDNDHDKDNPYKEASDESPKVKVLYEEPTVKPDPTPEPEPNAPKDNTVAPSVLPQTGDNSAIFIGIIGIVVLVSSIRLIYLKTTKNN